MLSARSELKCRSQSQRFKVWDSPALVWEERGALSVLLGWGSLDHCV